MEIELKVSEAIKSDVGRGFVRIDLKIMKKLGLTTGDIIKIQGKEKATGAIVIPGKPKDRDRSIIRMDGLIRNNTGARVDETVRIERIEPPEAYSLVIAPAIDRIKVNPKKVKECLVDKPVTKGDYVNLTNVPKQFIPDSGNPLKGVEEFFTNLLPSVPTTDVDMVVLQTSPEGLVCVGKETKVVVHTEPPKALEGGLGVNYEDLGGLENEILRVREMIELPLRHPQLFERLGVEAPKGILLQGPPGTGKTLLAKAVAHESGINFVSIAGPEIMSKFYGESEQRIREIFNQAEKNAPSIIFIDEIDSIAPKREEVTGEVERRVVAQLLALMDGLKARGRVIIIGATNRPNAIDPALRRPGRFDREIQLAVPNKKGRLEILQIHTRRMPLKDVSLEPLAKVTHGFVGADIAMLTKEAAMHCLRRVLPNVDLDKPLDEKVLSQIFLTMKDFEEGLRLVEPSAMREVMLEIPNIKWEQVGGLTDVKQRLRETVEWPLKHPEVFANHGVTPPRGVLLFGPPGTGKTLLAKAVATESEANFIAIRGPELLSKWVGESERAIREIFKKAKVSAPSIIFLDEIDSIAPKRGMFSGSHVTETVVNQLLTLMDGIEKLNDIVILAASNRPDMIDPALLRPGRFDRLLLIGAPDTKSRLEILKIHTAKMKLADDVDIKELAEQLEGYVGSDIENICREAVMCALRKDIKTKSVTKADFDEGISKLHPSVTKEVVEFYKELEKKLLGKPWVKDTSSVVEKLFYG